MTDNAYKLTLFNFKIYIFHSIFFKRGADAVSVSQIFGSDNCHLNSFPEKSVVGIHFALQ